MFKKYENIFRSRWKALWWAAGVLLTAYCTVPSEDHKSAVPPIKLSTISHMLKHAHDKPVKDPWGYDTPAPPAG